MSTAQTAIQFTSRRAVHQGEAARYNRANPYDVALFMNVEAIIGLTFEPASAPAEQRRAAYDRVKATGFGF